MVPEDITTDSIVSLDDDVIATTPEIAENDIIRGNFVSLNKLK